MKQRPQARQNGKLPAAFSPFSGVTMSPSAHTASSAAASHPALAEEDPVDAIVPMIPLVLPLVGAALMFLLAFIAVYMT